MLRCANIKSIKNPRERCIYQATKGDYCSRHQKHPRRFEQISTRLSHGAAKKIQIWWKLQYGFYLARKRTLAFFNRSICHNETELASLEPLDSVPRDYFFAIHENNRLWGFDIRTLVCQYESEAKLQNPYTQNQCSVITLERFRAHVDNLRSWKKPTHFEQAGGLTLRQNWSLRVLDVCLRLDMLGYRIATQWFNDLDIDDHRRLYATLHQMWNETLNLTNEQRMAIVPDVLFKWKPHVVLLKSDIDSIRRTNLNVIERLISSASQQSDKTLGAMYVVMGLSQVSYPCKIAYPWIIE